ncbi:MAG: DUF559 domain-containing protein [Pseudomonadota bacterium]
MRREPTDAEGKLWSIVRGKRLAGLKFKRQEQIGEFVVDFVCFDMRLIVEVDGGQHSDCPADEKRDAWLREQGFEVLRFWNNEVMQNPEGVARTIGEAASDPAPTATRRQAVKSAYPLTLGERNGSQKTVSKEDQP